MDISAMLATRGYAAGRPATAGEGGEGTGPGSAIAGAVRDFAATVARGDDAAMAAMTGTADAHALVTALSQSQLAVETAVAVRDRVVEAYQEILRMPV